MTQETPFAPDSAQYWIKRSITLRQSGRLQAAAEASQRALALAPGNADALSNLAHALRWQGRDDDGLEAVVLQLAIFMLGYTLVLIHGNHDFRIYR